MRADLHVHSTASDGTLSPRALVSLAELNGVDVLAIADHDSVEGIEEASNASHDAHVTLVPAVELSANDDGRDIHILAYHVDATDHALLELLAKSRAVRVLRAKAMVAELQSAGFDIDFDDVTAVSGDAAVGRSHVARALVGLGHSLSVTDAFSRLIGRGRPFYIAKESSSSKETIAAVRRFGAIPVLAHPGITKVDDLIPGMVADGLLGIEAYHADHDAADRIRYATLASRFGLVATGGTDYHGPEAPNPELGSVDVPDAEIRKLLLLGRIE